MSKLNSVERGHFIHSIYLRCKEQPELLKEVVDAATQGLQQAVKDADQKAIDMETLAFFNSFHNQKKVFKADKVKALTQEMIDKHSKTMRFKWVLEVGG